MEYKWFEEGGNWWYTDSTIDLRWHYFGEWADYKDDTAVDGDSQSVEWTEERRVIASSLDSEGAYNNLLSTPSG